MKSQPAKLIQDREVAAAIEARIELLRLFPGDRLPGEEELAVLLGLTRHGVRRGIAVLKREKKLQQQRGSGTYLTRPNPQVSLEKTFVLFGPFPEALLAETELFQQAAFEHEYHVQVVNSSSCRQSPEHERHFLERLLERPVAGLVFEPTPIEPTNFNRLDALRRAGVKVAVLNCPPTLISRHAVFLLDFERAGYMATVQLGMEGFRRQVLVSAQTSPNQWLHAAFKRGVEQAAAGFGIDLRIDYASPRFNERRGCLEWSSDANPPALADDTGYICSWVSGANFLRRELLRAGCRHVGLIAAARERTADVPFPYLLLDSRERYARVLEYLLDPETSALQSVHDEVQPVLVLPETASVAADSCVRKSKSENEEAPRR